MISGLRKPWGKLPAFEQLAEIRKFHYNCVNGLSCCGYIGLVCNTTFRLSTNEDRSDRHFCVHFLSIFLENQIA